MLYCCSNLCQGCTNIIRGDNIKTNEMGSACGAYGDSRDQHRVLWGDLRGKDHWEDLGVDGRGKDWIVLA
jgi:hypothetical protein